MKFIKLHGSGLVTRVSDEDYETLNAFPWILASRQYACRSVGVPGTRKTKLLLMHRVVLGAVKGQIVDHIDGDSLNNQRPNLRFADVGLNTHNAPSRYGSTSAYKGVCWAKDTQRWQAQYKYGGRSVYLGQYASEIDAARAYDEAVRKIYGANAFQNFPSRAAE